MNREDFPILNKSIIYFDNAATTLKPRVISEITDLYYHQYCSNIHRGSYDISIIADTLYDSTRYKIAKFINAKSENEIAFTSGTTDSLNKIVFGYFKNYLKEGDEIIISKSEHASNILPWLELSKEIGAVIKYAPLEDDYSLKLEGIKSVVTEKTKVISIAHITNVVGDVRDIKLIAKYAHENNILVVVDGAQSAAHFKIDVEDLDIDFLAFSAHKMCGPTGVGVMYVKERHTPYVSPVTYGGGMNQDYNEETVLYKKYPESMEVGTPNIAGVIAFSSIIDYLSLLGMDKIYNHEMQLRRYLVNELRKNDKIIIYNEFSESGIITINHKEMSSEKFAEYLNNFDICVRAGSHCAKILDKVFDVDSTVRISLYFYNDIDEVNYLINILK